MYQLETIPFHNTSLPVVDVDGEPRILLNRAFTEIGLKADRQIEKLQAVAVPMTIGALVPPSNATWVQRTGTTLRGAGMALAAGLLALWSIEFLGGEMDRGWVSAKNYAMMSLGAVFSCWFVGKGTRLRREVDNE